MLVGFFSPFSAVDVSCVEEMERDAWVCVDREAESDAAFAEEFEVLAALLGVVELLDSALSWEGEEEEDCVTELRDAKVDVAR